jgi:hypothetical protein
MGNGALAKGPKLPRPSSTLPFLPFAATRLLAQHRKVYVAKKFRHALPPRLAFAVCLFRLP